MIEILLPGFLLSLVLLGIHSWYGLTIIRRNIIFTDLAIGQLAALGGAVSLVLIGGKFLYPVSLGFALLGGLAVYITTKKSRHPEAVIGLIYALGFSAVFLVFAKFPQGMEHFQNLMAYDIIFTETGALIQTALLYAGIAVVLVLSQKYAGDKIRELIFFVTFSLTVTSSVKMAGVLIVFSILLAPAYIALFLAEHQWMPALFRKYPLMIAWVAGLIINTGAIVFSYSLDLPTGYSVVFWNALPAVILGLASRHENIAL